MSVKHLKITCVLKPLTGDLHKNDSCFTTLRNKLI